MIITDEQERIRATVAALPAAALAASKLCIAAAGESRGAGYSQELEATRLLLSNSETRQRVDAFLSGTPS